MRYGLPIRPSDNRIGRLTPAVVTFEQLSDVGPLCVMPTQAVRLTQSKDKGDDRSS